MSARPLNKRRGRKPAYGPRPRSCRGCGLRQANGECKATALRSGRCGDWVWYIRHGQQLHRAWTKPTDPRTRKQRRYRTRLAATSAKYSADLTDEQHHACIAEGKKRRTRPRMGSSGPLTGHQQWVQKQLKGKPDFNPKKRPRSAKVPQQQALPKKYSVQLPPPQPLTPTTWDTHRMHTGKTPGTHRPTTRGTGKAQDRVKNDESKPPRQPARSQVRRDQRLTPHTWKRYSTPAVRHPASRRPPWRRHRRRGVVRFVQHPASNPMFGTFIKELRMRRQLSLREFCLEHGHAPGNWSRLERELLPPPHDQQTLRAWAKHLGLKPNTADWQTFFDTAAVAAGRIPDHILQDKTLAAQLPALFRALSAPSSSRFKVRGSRFKV
jgi:transcriptional regulator with XRE-family HTH domain